MAIRLGAERVAESLRNDEWFWHGDADNKQTRSLREWATLTGTPYGTMTCRQRRGYRGRDIVYGRSNG